MINTAARKCAFALSFSLAAFGASSAQAQTYSADFLDALTRIMDQSGYVVGFKDVAQDGDTVTANRVRAQLKNLDSLEGLDSDLEFLIPNGAFTIPAPLIAEGVATEDDGTYTASKLYFPEMNFSLEDGDVEITVGEVAYSGIRLPSGSPSIADMMSWIAGSSFGPIDIVIEDIPAFRIEPIVSTNTFEPAQSADFTSVSSTFSAPSITFFVENAPEPLEEPFDVVLGPGNIVGSIDGQMDWNLSDGRLQISSYRMAADGLGQFEFTMDLSGMTLDVMEQLMGLAELDPMDPAMQAQLMEFGMGLAARSLFYGMTVRYDDFGGVDRFFSWVEEDENMTRTEMADELLNEVRDMFTQIGLTEELVMVETAVNGFLSDTQSMELRIEPTQPLPIISFLGLAATPKVLADTLNVTLVANE